MIVRTQFRSIVDLQPRVVELGKIKIGNKGEERQKQNGTGTYRIPQKLDHFVITTLERDQKGDFKPDLTLMQQLAATQKCEPNALREIPIAFLSDEIEDVFPTSYVYYAGNKCIARSDGETIEWLCDPRTQQPLAEPKIAENKNNYVQTATVGEGNKKTRMFKPHGTLNCIIAAEGARWGGVYKLRTTSIISIEQIVSGLMQVKQLTRGFLRNVPLRLVMRPMQVSPEGKTTTVFVCHVEIRGTDLTEVQQKVIEAARVEIATDRQLQQVRQQYLALAAAPGEAEGEDEQADVNEEFSPETQGPVVDVTPPPVGPTLTEVLGKPPTVADALAAPATLLERIAAATEADLKALQSEIVKADDATKLAYFERRKLLTGQPVPADVLPKVKRTRVAPPPPPARTAPVVPPAPVATPAAINPDDIPF